MSGFSIGKIRVGDGELRGAADPGGNPKSPEQPKSSCLPAAPILLPIESIAITTNGASAINLQCVFGTFIFFLLTGSKIKLGSA